MKKLLLIISFIILSRFIYSCCVGIVKPAVYKFNIKDEKYIICQYMPTSGFNWRMIQNENGEEVNEYLELNFSKANQEECYLNEINYKTKMADNQFIIYFSDKYIGKNNIGEDCIVYDVKEWDILYPIHRNRFLGLFESTCFINKNDIDTNNKKFIYFIIIMLIPYSIYRYKKCKEYVFKYKEYKG